MKKILITSASLLIRRNKDVILLRSCHDNFTGHIKYFHLEIKKRFSKKRLIWSVKHKKDQSHFKKLGIETCISRSWKHKYLLYKVGYIVSDGGLTLGIPDPYNTLFQIDFDHGFPIKKSGLEVHNSFEHSEKKIQWFKNNTHRVIFAGQSRYACNTILGAYGLPKELGRPIGAPRITPLLMSEAELHRFIDSENDALKQFRDRVKNYDKVYLYLPTYRDGGADFLKKLKLNIEKLNATLKNQNALFVFKMHPLCTIDVPSNTEHIIHMSQTVDIYPMMALSDCIISDYSSTYVDAMWCKNKQVLLIHGDIDDYDKDRGLVKERIDDIRKHAMILDDFPELNRFIEGEIPYAPLPQDFIDKYWDPEVLKNPHQYIDFIK